MASDTASNVIQGLSLKSHFVPIWVLAQLILSFNFFKELAKLKKKNVQRSHPSDLIQAKVLLTWITNTICLEKYQSSVSIGLTLKLAKNVILEIDLISHFQIMWGWYFFHLVFPQNFLRWTSSPQTAYFKCMKTLGTPCTQESTNNPMSSFGLIE